jgi:hypothetical protein
VIGAGRAISRVFWPVGEAAQADYEALRADALAVEPNATLSLSAIRFARRGLAGLIAWPTSEPVFTGPVLGGARPRWSPYDDPRTDALAAGFAYLLGVDAGRTTDAMMEGLVR